MNAIDNPILGEMGRICKRNILKYHVGQVMWCPTCGRILDCRRAVSFDFIVRETNQLARTFIKCAECWDKAQAELHKLEKVSQFRFEVTDGRIVFATPKDIGMYGKSATIHAPIKAKDVRVGDRYQMRHTSGDIVARVVWIRKFFPWSHSTGRRTTRYMCVNENTGKDITVKSAVKFRKLISRGETEG